MADRFAELKTFVVIAEAGSLSRAAERLATTKSVASKRLAELEARLSVRLVNRVARGLTLTEAGARLYERATRLLDELAEVEADAAAEHAALRGPLRIAAPVTFGTLYLQEALMGFATAHPGICLDLELDDRMVDLIGGGYDLAIRIGTLPDSSLIGRTLAPHRHILCASPGYLERHGAPTEPDALRDHDALVYSNRDSNPTWRLANRGGSAKAYRIRPRLRVNNGDLLLGFATAGFGIASLPAFLAAGPISRGELAIVLPSWAPTSGTISAIYPASRHLPSKARAAINHLAAAFEPVPPWERTLSQLA